MNNSKGAPGLLEDRFWRFVTPGEEDECWIWTGCTNWKGYGLIRDNYVTLKAHRVSYEIHQGPIPEGMLVCHTCDVRTCVNPKHLFIGTAQDNEDDKQSKGRHFHKLNAEQIYEILTSTESQYSLADKFGVTQSAISLAKRRYRLES